MRLVGFLRKGRRYRAAFLPVVEGQAHGIDVRLRNYPIREADDDSGTRVEFFPDFNVYLLNAIWKEIPEYERFIIDACRSPLQFDLQVKDCPPISFQIQLSEKKSQRQFRAEMPDALINAFERSAIGR